MYSIYIYATCACISSQAKGIDEGEEKGLLVKDGPVIQTMKQSAIQALFLLANEIPDAD